MNLVSITLSIAIIINAYLTYLFWNYWKNRIKGKSYSLKLEFENTLKKIKRSISFLENAVSTREGTIVSISIELSLIAFWAAVVGYPYLNVDPSQIPAGREFSGYIQFHHLWTRAIQCGWCATWNGSTAGGFPAFVDLYGSALHPVVIVTTLLFGVVNGAKLSIVIAFWVTGISQWWLAYELKLGRIARLWSACIAVAAGHITGRMEVGSFGMVFSTAFISLIFANILAIYNGKGKRFTVLLGIIGASAILSGQGYFQAGLVGIMPAIVFLILDNFGKIKNLWKNYALAFFLACLLAAPLLVPLAHFYPNIEKGTDFNFDIAQPLQYIPLNLIIDNWQFYTTDGLLGKAPYPSLYVIYIGWVPFLLAILGFLKFEPSKAPVAGYMLGSVVLSHLIASAVLLKEVVNFIPWVANIRFAPVISGLSVPFILGFSAYGLNHLIKIDWSKIRPNSLKISIQFLLVIPILISLTSVYNFSRMVIYTESLEEDDFSTLNALKTIDAQWVNPPYGEQFFAEPAIAMGLKISPGIMPWSWRDRETPRPFLEASREDGWDDYQLISDVHGTGIYANPNEIYASILTDQGNVIPCSAKGIGGIIEVYCDSENNGVLTIKENYFSGWQVQINEKQANILKEEYWLATQAPAGKNVYVFKYLPWDVPLGIILSLFGIFLCTWLWSQPGSSVKQSRENQQQTH